MFKCDYCGQFISVAELENGQATHTILYQDTEYTAETWETYHEACKAVLTPRK
jgi:hypothetical protein